MSDIIDELGTESGDIRRRLQEAGETTWGYTIYRCTYKSDDEWKQYVDVLNARTRATLEVERNLDMKDSLDWSFQQDPSYDGASKDHIRSLFREKTAQAGQSPYKSPKYAVCLMVDQACVDSCLKGPQPPDSDRSGEAYAIVINSLWKAPAAKAEGGDDEESESADEEDDDETEEKADGEDAEEDEEDEEEEDEDDYDSEDESEDEGLDPVDGLTVRDVGWMKVGLAYIAPRLFNVLGAMHWDDIYARPPRVVCP